MNDYNNGMLQDPCLRLDYGFGEEWASVELGDGTGYVRLADYEKLASENAKLRELVRDMYPSYCYANGGNSETYLTYEQDAGIRDRVRKLGVLGE